jgi:hypothetical protein
MDGSSSDVWEMLTRGSCAMRLAEGVTSSDKGNRLGVVHTHAAESFPDIKGRHHRITITIRTLRVNVDKAHMSGAKGLLKFSGTPYEVGAAIVPDIVSFRDEGCLGTPEHALIRLPRIGSASSKTKDREAHLLEGNIAS